MTTVLGVARKWLVAAAVFAALAFPIGGAHADEAWQDYTTDPVKIMGSSGTTCATPAAPNKAVPKVCGSRSQGIAFPGEWEFGQPRIGGCPGFPAPVIDQHVTLTVVQPLSNPGDNVSTFVYVIGDRLDGRKQTYCVTIPVRFIQ